MNDQQGVLDLAEPEEEDTPEIDLTLVAEGYRVINDPSAWDELVEVWDRKLTEAGFDNPRFPTFDALSRQYSRLGGLLKRLGAPMVTDPVARAVRLVKEPSMVISRQMRVLAINAEGQEAFRVEQGRIAELDWLMPFQRKEFMDFLRSPRPDEKAGYRIFQTVDRRGHRGYAEVFGLQPPDLHEPVLAVRELTSELPPRTGEVLRKAFDLTEAEIEIARLLHSHADLGKVAELRGTSLRTVRTQISNIFFKTETASQVDLVRLLAHIGARIAEREEHLPYRWSDPYGREAIMHRSDGRRLAHSWIGDPNGRPALFLPGIVHGYLFPEVFEEVLKAAGVRLIVLTRPGVGHSCPGDPQQPLAEHIDAIREFCATQGLRNLPAVGIHGANVPLVKIAASNDNPFSEVVAVGRFLSISGGDWLKVPRLPRTLLWLAIHAPWAAEVVCAQAWRTLAQQGLDWYIDRAYGDMHFDFQFTRSAEISALMRNACAYTFLQSHQPFLDDFRLRAQDVRPDLASLRVRLTWLLGGIDVYSKERLPGTFYSTAQLDEVARSSPLVTIEKVAQAADLLTYQRPQLVAERIAEAVARAAA